MLPMQFIIKRLFGLCIFSIPAICIGQSTYLPQGHKHQQLLDRLEIKLQRNADLNVLTPKPISRRIGVRAVEYADSLASVQPDVFSKADRHNIRSFLMNNTEWVSGTRDDFSSQRPLFNTFYKTRANFVEVNEKDFFLAVNPVIQQLQSIEADNDERVFLNAKGISFRGMIAERIGFSGYVTDNQERPPGFVQDYIADREAVPGFGRYNRFKNTGYDYFDARGSIHFTAAKYLDFQFGFDKNFIGNGYRSLLLSDFGNSYLFLKINTRIWKLNYMNLFMELAPQFSKSIGDRLLDKKYAVMHHLSLNATPWLNIGLFEAIVFGRRNHFDFTYMNPIIFLRAAERNNNSPDNAVVGFDFKANIARRFQLYGQFMLDEFKLSELRGGNGWWANKFGIQAGAKYIDALGINNFDLQGEINIVRPFSYSHHDSVTNYTHYNQPLAHPFGANFIEAIGIVRYQPHPRWNTSARFIVWTKGVDTAGSNFGGDIFLLNNTRTGDYGYTIPSGVPGTGINTQLLVSFEAKENLFIEGSLLLRRWRVDEATALNRNSNVVTLGVRMNMFRREYDF